jgi:hypothetical protein
MFVSSGYVFFFFVVIVSSSFTWFMCLAFELIIFVSWLVDMDIYRVSSCWIFSSPLNCILFLVVDTWPSEC